MASLNQLAITKEKRRRAIKRNIFIWGLLALPILHFLVFFVYANFSSIFLSFQDAVGHWTLVNYKNTLWTDLTVPKQGHYRILEAVGYSFFLGFNDVLLVLISLILAYFIYKKIPGRQIFRVVFFLPSIIAITVYVVCYKLLLSDTYGIPGLKSPTWFMDGTIMNKLLVPLYCLWVGVGYNILVLGGAMANVPGEVIENAKLEGVSRFRELFQIIIPMIWPTLIVSFVGSITVVFSLFMQVDLITGGSQGTLTIAYIINSSLGSNKNYAAALGILFTIISIPVVLLVKKLLDKIGKKWGY